MKAGPSPSGPPPELRLTLSSIRAPLLSHNPKSKDEGGAWGSREYLRKRLIGRNVGFIVIDKMEGGRLFGEIYEKKGGEGVRVGVVGGGWGKVVEGGKDGEEVLGILKGLEEGARKGGKGIWGGSGEGGRVLEGMLGGKELVDLYGGRKIKGVVEYVVNGSVMKVYFGREELGAGVEKDYLGMVCLVGVQCPGFRRPEGKLPDGSLPIPEPLPFALNARYMTEVKLLNRDVVVTLVDTEKNGLLFGDVKIVGNSEFNIGVELLKRGFAKTVGWSLEFSENAPALRSAERQARDARLAIWKDYVPQNTVGEAESFFSGQVIEVVSGDLITVMVDGADPTEEPKRISLASVKAPRIARGSAGSRGEMYAGMGYVAKEALRKSLIGRRVNVKVEYVRQPGETAVRKTPMTFATVERVSDSNKKTDVALALISTGMLTVIRHRGEEERASNYEEYLEREKVAISEKVGVHKANSQDSTTGRINDLTTQDSKRRAESMLRELSKTNPHQGIVEYISTGSRYRVYLPKKAMLITIALKAVRVPQPSRRTFLPDGSVREEKAAEPHGDQALAFAREKFLQRDVDVFITSVDRIGAFLGNMGLRGSHKGINADISHALIESGHGYLHESFDPRREAGGTQLISAEKTARESKKGVWIDYVEEEISATTNGEANGMNGSHHEVVKGTVCEVGTGGRLYVHIGEAPSLLQSIEQGLAAISLDKQPPILLANIKPSATVCAKFTDDQWYRAQVLHKQEGHARVHFIDYGNEAWVEPKDVRPLPTAGWAGSSRVATKVTMTDIKVPEENEEGCMEAGRFLYDEAYGKKVTINVSRKTKEGIEGTITVGDEKSSEKGLREKMLEAGFARVLRKSGKEGQALMAKLGSFEDAGKSKRAGLWRHGDPYASDEDDDELTKERNKKRYG